MITGGVPGDQLEVALLGRRQGVARGAIRRIIRPSPDRVAPFCAVFEACGGCAWQQVALSVQRREKHALAARALGPDADKLLELGDVPSKGWRRRARLHLRSSRGAAGAPGPLACGLMAQGSDALVVTSDCPVLDPRLTRLLAASRDWLQGRISQAEVHAAAGEQGVVCAISARPLPGAEPPELNDAALRTLGVQGLLLEFGRHRARHGLVEVTLPETADLRPVTVDASGFCQASEAGNRAIRQAVRQAVLDGGPLQRVQEFFAGSGNLGAALAGLVPEVRCVEADSRAVSRARAALCRGASAGTRYEVVLGDAEQRALAAGPDELWLLDPGRPGAAGLCARAVRDGPDQLIYVSCAPDTLQRDLKVLRQGGYAVVSAKWIDAFPHTPHLEMVVHLARSPQRTPSLPERPTLS